MKYENVPPAAYSLMESTRSVGYSLKEAVADIIDNSIAADANNVWIEYWAQDDPYLYILDDGEGLTAHQLTKAMQYGSTNPVEIRKENDLGRFGLGLKTASLSQCRVLTVISKCNNKIEARRWDLDFIESKNEWTLLLLDNEEISKLPGVDQLNDLEQGTLVIWQKLDRMLSNQFDSETLMGHEMDEVRDHLSLVFHRFLDGNSNDSLNIFFNNTLIESLNPFCKAQKLMDDEVFQIKGKDVIVRSYLLPRIEKLKKRELQKLGGREAIQKDQGFYIYRNKRLLVWGTWFRIIPKKEISKYARIQIDLPNDMDDIWKIDIKKSTAVLPPVLRKNLTNLTKKLGEQSKRTYTFRGKKETSSDIEHVWNRFKRTDGGVYYEINKKHPIVRMLKTEAPQLEDELDRYLVQIERSLPYNQIIVDVDNDQRIENFDDVDTIELEKSLDKLLKIQESKKSKLEFLDLLRFVEPFNNYPELIEKRKNILNEC